jgi:hypothetical protein
MNVLICDDMKIETDRLAELLNDFGIKRYRVYGLYDGFGVSR